MTYKQCRRRPSRSRAPRLLASAALLVAVGGCSSFRKVAEDTKISRLPIARMSSDTVVLQITFLNYEAGDVGINEHLWDEVDEQYFSIAFRRHLLDNGLRCGIVGTKLPARLRELLNGKGDVPTNGPLDANADDGSFGFRTRRLQNRAGHLSEIVASPVHPQMSVLTRREGSLGGQTFHQAQGLFAVRCFPRGDGRVLVEVTPEIRHGPVRQKWVGAEVGFRYAAEQAKESFDWLRMESLLSPGQTLVLGTVGEGVGMGGQFLGKAGRDPQQKLLLIRLAQSQSDDLFDMVNPLQPLATPLP